MDLVASSSKKSEQYLFLSS